MLSIEREVARKAMGGYDYNFKGSCDVDSLGNESWKMLPNIGACFVSYSIRRKKLIFNHTFIS